MPEGPEVKYLAEYLNKKVQNKNLTCIQIAGGRYLKKKPEGYEIFIKLLPLKVASVGSKGKFIYFTFQYNEANIWNTLGMSGDWTQEDHKHTALQFTFENMVWNFIDQRRFGTFKFTFTTQELVNKLNTLGPDVISDKIENNWFRETIRKKKTKMIVDVLTDQKIISGIGNYLVAEILYAAKISPFRQIKDISDQELSKLLKAIITISKASFQKQQLHSYSQNLPTFTFKIYKQDKDPLGNPVKKEKRKNGRMTHWVPSVQT